MSAEPENPTPEEIESARDTMLAVTLTFMLVPYFALLKGYAMSLLWSWFVVPVTDLGPIAWFEGAGLLLIADMVNNPSVKKTVPDGQKLATLSAAAKHMTIVVLLRVALGYAIYYLFMT